MAKTKKSSAQPQQPAGFYEALPLALMPPAAVPLNEPLGLDSDFLHAKTARRLVRKIKQVPKNASQLSQTLRARLEHPKLHHPNWHKLGAQTLRVLHLASIQIRIMGLATTNKLIAASRLLRYSLTYSAQATHNYVPPIAADVRSYTRRTSAVVAGRKARWLYLITITLGVVSAVTVGTVIAANTIKTYANDISSPAALMAVKRTGTVILDRNGKTLFSGYGAQVPDPISLNSMPESLKNATIAAEDPHFYTEPGFSIRGIARATWIDLTHGSADQGGSTLSQQLIKNAVLNSNKNLSRKYQELLLSVELTHRYSKNQILDMYLNDIYYGQGSTGVQVASETYFHEPASSLTLGQSALLAGLPLGPSRFDPNFDLGAATGRRNYVLDRMAALGMITQDHAKTAEAQPIQLAAAGAPETAPAGTQPMMVYARNVTIQAPWFVFYVLDQLQAQYGDDILDSGITVRTTLNLDDEQTAERIIAGQVNNLQSHHVDDGALVSLNPSNGDILSMVGSSNYNAPGFGNVNATLSQLQPGSSFKPIAYATALEKGWTGATQVLDAPISFPQANGQTYTPQNYDLKFHGVVTLRHALDNSLNIPAIKVLQFATIPATLQTAHNMGITGLNDPSEYGLSLVLGGGDVTPIDMATVYATLDNEGVKVEPRAILEVLNRHGQNITKDTQPAAQQVLDPRIAYMLTNIMADNQARLPEFPLNGPLELDRPAAAKTGTTNDFRDNWTIGYTPQVVTAVWVGNADHSAMENVDGITGAAPIWHDYMEAVSAGTPVENFSVPTGITMLKVCSDGGLAPNGGSGTYDEVFMSDTLPTRQCGTSDLGGDTTLPTTPPPLPVIPAPLATPEPTPVAPSPEPTTQPQ